MDFKGLRTTVFTFIAAALGVLCVSLGFSFVFDAKLMDLCISLSIVLLLFANTFLLYGILYKLDNISK